MFFLSDFILNVRNLISNPNSSLNYAGWEVHLWWDQILNHDLLKVIWSWCHCHLIQSSVIAINACWTLVIKLPASSSYVTRLDHQSRKSCVLISCERYARMKFQRSVQSFTSLMLRQQAMDYCQKNGDAHSIVNQILLRVIVFISKKSIANASSLTWKQETSAEYQPLYLCFRLEIASILRVNCWEDRVQRVTHHSRNSVELRRLIENHHNLIGHFEMIHAGNWYVPKFFFFSDGRCLFGMARILQLLHRSSGILTLYWVFLG